MRGTGSAGRRERCGYRQSSGLPAALGAPGIGGALRRWVPGRTDGPAEVPGPRAPFSTPRPRKNPAPGAEGGPLPVKPIGSPRTPSSAEPPLRPPPCAAPAAPAAPRIFRAAPGTGREEAATEALPGPPRRRIGGTGSRDAVPGRTGRTRVLFFNPKRKTPRADRGGGAGRGAANVRGAQREGLRPCAAGAVRGGRDVGGTRGPRQHRIHGVFCWGSVGSDPPGTHRRPHRPSNPPHPPPPQIPAFPPRSQLRAALFAAPRTQPPLCRPRCRGREVGPPPRFVPFLRPLPPRYSWPRGRRGAQIAAFRSCRRAQCADNAALPSPPRFYNPPPPPRAGARGVPRGGHLQSNTRSPQLRSAAPTSGPPVPAVGVPIPAASGLRPRPPQLRPFYSPFPWK